MQPDVHLESEVSRVDATLTLRQVEKYVRLHRELNTLNGDPKRPYILFLVKRLPLKLAGVKTNFQDRDAAAARNLSPEMLTAI